MTEEQQHVDEEEQLRLPDEVTPYKYEITSYGADYPVDGLVARLKRGDIYVPSFQRNYVWGIGEPRVSSSRFFSGCRFRGSSYPETKRLRDSW